MAVQPLRGGAFPNVAFRWERDSLAQQRVEIARAVEDADYFDSSFIGQEAVEK
jgi:hypothetical protein